MSDGQVVWKLKHIPSGEYAKASNSKFRIGYTTVYLSDMGKVFLRKPKVPDVPVYYWGNYHGTAEVSDWILEEYRLVML